MFGNGNIKSTWGNITRGGDVKLKGLLSANAPKLESIVGNLTTNLSNIWSGGFTGMSETGIDELKAALTKYSETIQAKIDSFDQNGDITSAFKGEIQTAAYDFIAAIKYLMQAYVTHLEQGIKDAELARKSFSESASSISKDVTSAAQDIRSNADSIRLD